MLPTTGALYYGDCLDWMGQWDDQTVDLVYLDPPFNSQATYNVLFNKTVGGAQYRAFEDTWHWDTDAAARFDAYRSAIARPAHAAIVGLETILGPSGMLSYLTYMADRLEHCHRLLKPTGSLYLHCDPTASHYLKIVLDAIFGAEHFRNEIIWCYRGMPSKAMKFQSKHDVILSYVASKRGGGYSTPLLELQQKVLCARSAQEGGAGTMLTTPRRWSPSLTGTNTTKRSRTELSHPIFGPLSSKAGIHH